MPARMMLQSLRIVKVASVAVLLLWTAAVYAGDQAADPSVFAPGKCQSAQLKFVDGLPVVTAAGTPEEIGQQLGTLLKDPITSLLDKKNDIAHGFGLSEAPNLLVRMSRLVVPAFPDSQHREIEALAKSAGTDLDTLAFANIMYEVSHFPACSSMAVEADRSTTGNTIFGRNLDFPTFGFLDKYSLIEVIRPQGKHALLRSLFLALSGYFPG